LTVEKFAYFGSKRPFLREFLDSQRNPVTLDGTQLPSPPSRPYTITPPAHTAADINRARIRLIIERIDMSDDETLYRFLTTKLKEAGLPIESLPVMLGVSRSTLYRNMKGTVRMSSAVQAGFTSLLNLNADDEQYFDRLAGLVTVDPTLVEARRVLDRFVLGDDADVEESEVIRLAVYENDTFLRTTTQVYDRIIDLATAEGATATIRVINCTTDVPFHSVATFMEELLTRSDAATAEHLLTLPTNDYAGIVTVITRLLPLLQFNRYTVRYSEAPLVDARLDEDSASPSNCRTVFANSVSVEIRNGSETTLFLLSFVKAELSSCLITYDPSVIEFFRHNYDAVRRHHLAALVDSTDLNFFNDTIANLEEGRNVALIKPNFCLDRIPVSVYGSMVSRLSAEELAFVQTSLAGAGGDPTLVLEMVFATMERRVEYSRTNRHIDVCSVQGLTELVQTGRISDHLDFMPSLTADELRVMLAGLQARLNDPEDPYTLYLTREEVFPQGYVVVACEGAGVLFEFDPAEYRKGNCRNLYIANRWLAEVFMDYAVNHIPQVRAMNLDDTNTFLTGLIESI